MIMLGLFKLPFLYRDARFQFKGDSSTPWGAVLMGWLSRRAGHLVSDRPILGGIMTLSATSETMNQGNYLARSLRPWFGCTIFLGGFSNRAVS